MEMTVLTNVVTTRVWVFRNRDDAIRQAVTFAAAEMPSVSAADPGRVNAMDRMVYAADGLCTGYRVDTVMVEDTTRAECPRCGRTVRLKGVGTMYRHDTHREDGGKVRCPGSDRVPSRAAEDIAVLDVAGRPVDVGMRVTIPGDTRTWMVRRIEWDHPYDVNPGPAWLDLAAVEPLEGGGHVETGDTRSCFRVSRALATS